MLHLDITYDNDLTVEAIVAIRRGDSDAWELVNMPQPGLAEGCSIATPEIKQSDRYEPEPITTRIKLSFTMKEKA